MYRLIKYHQQYESDVAKFSDCSTIYTLLGLVSPEEATAEALLAFAKSAGMAVVGDAFEPGGTGKIRVSLAIELSERVQTGGFDPKPIAQYLGLVDLSRWESGTLQPVAGPDAPVNAEQAIEIIDAQEYGMDSSGQLVDGGYVLVKSGWESYHILPLLGYSRDSFLEALEVTEEGFYDDTSSCSECGKYDSNDNGYTYNFRYTEDGQVGINCGCWAEHCESNVESFADDPRACIERDVADALEAKGKLKHVEQLVGGMTDSHRHHSYGGDSARIATPESVLKELKLKHPKRRYVFTHDESGQFQTYFSVWQLLAKPAKRRAASKARRA